MSVIKSVLKDERARLLMLFAIYNKRIRSYPKGAIVIKKISGHSYAYRTTRNGSKVETEYVGRAGTLQASRAIEKQKSLRKYLGLAKQIKNKLREIDKAL